jgi:hypothetical protein
MFKVELKNPNAESHIKLDGSVDFTYIMRKDGPYVANQLAPTMNRRTGIERSLITSTIGYYYDAFHAELVEILGRHFSSNGQKVDIHLYDSDSLEKLVLEKIEDRNVVNVDPLLEGCLPSLSTSRHYALSGTKALAQGERPGSPSVQRQIQELAKNSVYGPAVVTEDDVFSGKSMVEVIVALRQQGIKCSMVCPGIQIGAAAAFSELQILVDPVVRYSSATSRDILDQVDLGDARDFLLGASGLVVILPDKSLGRAPYVMPFVSPNARVGIPADQEIAFSREILVANLNFFRQVETLLGEPMVLSDVDPSFAHMCSELYGLHPNTPMTKVVTWALNEMGSLYRINKELGTLQNRFHKLNLPERMVLLDLNGTIIPDDAHSCQLPAESKLLLQHQISRLAASGIQVGLCSDSPLDPLYHHIAKPLGIKGPIIAENGNVIRYQNVEFCLRELSMIQSLRDKITDLIESSFTPYNQQKDCLSMEFGGKLPRFELNEWAFGAGRKTSISVFGPPQLIEYLDKHLPLEPGLSKDASPQYNYFAIHPSNFRTNKGETLRALAAFGYDMTMVGNSMSDWVAPDSKVRCGFVGESTVSDDILAKASLTSEKPCAEGVIEILSRL